MGICEKCKEERRPHIKDVFGMTCRACCLKMYESQLIQLVNVFEKERNLITLKILKSQPKKQEISKSSNDMSCDQCGNYSFRLEGYDGIMICEDCFDTGKGGQ